MVAKSLYILLLKAITDTKKKEENEKSIESKSL